MAASSRGAGSKIGLAKKTELMNTGSKALRMSTQVNSPEPRSPDLSKTQPRFARVALTNQANGKPDVRSLSSARGEILPSTAREQLP